MSKKKHPIRKLFALTTTIAAVGGACYVFRDKIKENAAFQSATNKLSDLLAKKGKNDVDLIEDENDDEDEFADVFSDNSTDKREYTSITINSKKEESIPTIDITSAEETQSETEQKESVPAENASEKKQSAGSGKSGKKEKNDKAEAYENEGLSDLSEDTDALEEQDKLDF